MVSVKKIVMVTLVAVTMLGLGGLFPHAEASKLDEVQSRGCLLVGTTGDSKPMSYLNRETGRYEGFDTEASELLAQSLGVQVKFIPTTWSTLTADTLAGKFDIAMCGITRTLAREQKMAQSNGYLVFGKTILCRKDDAKKFKTLADMNKKDVRVMVNPGGTNEKFALANLPDCTLIVHQQNAEIPGLIAEGKADIMITETMEARRYVRDNAKLAAPLIEEPFTKNNFGILMQQGDMAAAKPILADIIANGLSPKGERLALQDDLDANFNATTENGKESIFEVQFSVGANNNGNYGFLLNYPHNTGPGGCCGFYQPSYELVNSFQVDENGLPYLEGEYRNKKSVTERVTDYDYISKNDKTIAVDPRLDFAVGRMEIPYKDWGLPANDWVRNVSSGGVFLPKKHVYSKAEQDAGLAGSTYSSGWAPGSAMNLQYLCLRDCKLLYAECLANDGELSAAMQQVNDIRERAAKPDNIIYLEDGTPAANYLVKPYPSSHAAFSNKETCIKAIQMERKLELAMEGQRFFDLVRWGGDYMNKELTAYINYEKQYLTKFYGVSAPIASKTIFPIPETEIQTAGNDENGQAYLVQNDAWK